MMFVTFVTQHTFANFDFYICNFQDILVGVFIKPPQVVILTYVLYADSIMCYIMYTTCERYAVITIQFNHIPMLQCTHQIDLFYNPNQQTNETKNKTNKPLPASLWCY